MSARISIRLLLAAALLVAVLLIGLGPARAGQTGGPALQKLMPLRAGALATPPNCGATGVVTSPSVINQPPYATYNALRSVAAFGPSDVWAVGLYSKPVPPEEDEFEPLIEHWDGSAWTIVPPPYLGWMLDDQLYGVAGVAAADIWAVGYIGYNQDVTLAEHWNGSAWSRASTPNVAGASLSRLDAVAALAADDAWAVGSYTVNSPAAGGTLIERWNGHVWSIVPGAPIAGQYPALHGLAAVAANDIWAVGDVDSQPLAEHWNGSAWSQVAIPAVGASGSLRGVAARAPDDVWAVGAAGGGALTLHWNGTAWNVVPLPLIDGGADLESAAFHAKNDAWAAGYHISNGAAQPLLLRWNGTGWRQVASPSPQAGNILYGLAILPGDLWTVGESYPSSPDWGSSTLVERQGLAPWSDLGGDPFQSYIETLYCRGSVDGYPDNTFRPSWDTLRRTLARWVVQDRGWPFDTSGGPHFADVPPGDVQYPAIETAYHHGVIGGYADGTFRPTGAVTRAQMSKMVVIGMGWAIDTTGGPHFRDVPPSNPFYATIETLYNHGAVNGYGCGMGCLEFRWGNSLTRSQLAKVLALAGAP